MLISRGQEDEKSIVRNLYIFKQNFYNICWAILIEINQTIVVKMTLHQIIL